MKEAILDSDTLSYVINARDPVINETSRQYLKVFRHFTVSVVTISEVVEGLVRVGDPIRLAAFLDLTDDYSILPVETEEAVLAGRILGALARIGQKIGDLDPFIAAVAISNEMPLVTNNHRHYERIIELGFPLRLENWRVP